MKILYLAHRLPYPLNKGEKIRTFHQICHLSRHHIIHLICMVDDPTDLQYVKLLERYCASVTAVYSSKAATMFLAVGALLSQKPLSVVSFYRKQLTREIENLLAVEQFDVIFVSSSAMAEYVLPVSHIPKAIDFVDVDSEKWRLYADYHMFPFSWIYRREANLLAAYEEKIAKIFNCSVFISEQERSLFQQRVNDRPISVISNGVDSEYFSPHELVLSSSDHPVVVFTGNMDYFPNIDAVLYFCTEIFPLVCQTVPETQFFIVGRNPVRSVRELGNQQNVVVTGSVADVRPYLTKAAVAVAPFRIARGVQNKILEAMAMGLPVVGTVEAFKGIAASEQDGIRIANDPESFAQHLTTFLRRDTMFGQQAGRRARSYVERHHRWEEQGVKLERLLEEVVWGNAVVKAAGAKRVDCV